jgi:G:T-mismatch repair DNA endonuclease (very short patch repair protein)
MADSLTTAGRLTVFRSLHRLQTYNRQLLIGSLLRRHGLLTKCRRRQSVTSPNDLIYVIGKRDLINMIHLCYFKRRK